MFPGSPLIVATGFWGAVGPRCRPIVAPLSPHCRRRCRGCLLRVCTHFRKHSITHTSTHTHTHTHAHKRNLAQREGRMDASRLVGWLAGWLADRPSRFDYQQIGPGVSRQTDQSVGRTCEFRPQTRAIKMHVQDYVHAAYSTRT